MLCILAPHPCEQASMDSREIGWRKVASGGGGTRVHRGSRHHLPTSAPVVWHDLCPGDTPPPDDAIYRACRWSLIFGAEHACRNKQDDTDRHECIRGPIQTTDHLLRCRTPCLAPGRQYRENATEKRKANYRSPIQHPVRHGATGRAGRGCCLSRRTQPARFE